MLDAPALRGRLGRFIETPDAGARAFVPPPLPADPPIDILPLLAPLGRAERALGRLDGVAMLLPRHELFLYMSVREQAGLASQVKGARADEPIEEIREVSNYVDAMMFGLERLAEQPLSLRLIREMHARLMRGRGGDCTREALFVPPPATELDAALDAFERFMHEDPSSLPILIKAGLLRAQFEAIHPFPIGNGRLGVLLVTLYLHVHGVLGRPLLYLSMHPRTRRADHHRLMQGIRERGSWEAWLEFFLDSVAETANQAFDAATRIVELFKHDRERIAAQGEHAGAALRIHDHLQQSPFATGNQLVKRTGLSAPTVNAALADLERLGIVEEVTGRQRGRVFGYRHYITILGEGVDPAPSA